MKCCYAACPVLGLPAATSGVTFCGLTGCKVSRSFCTNVVNLLPSIRHAVCVGCRLVAARPVDRVFASIRLLLELPQPSKLFLRVAPCRLVSPGNPYFRYRKHCPLIRYRYDCEDSQSRYSIELSAGQPDPIPPRLRCICFLVR